MDYVITDNNQPTALDRVDEASRLLGYTANDDVVINVQGDEAEQFHHQRSKFVLGLF